MPSSSVDIGDEHELLSLDALREKYVGEKMVPAEYLQDDINRQDEETQAAQNTLLLVLELNNKIWGQMQKGFT